MKDSVVKAVRLVLLELGCSSVTVDKNHKHPRVLWVHGKHSGFITVPGTPRDGRCVRNNVAMARRLLRQALQE